MIEGSILSIGFNPFLRTPWILRVLLLGDTGNMNSPFCSSAYSSTTMNGRSFLKWSHFTKTYIWSNYSDLTRPHPKWWFTTGIPLISGKSRLVKYYNLARYIANMVELTVSQWFTAVFSDICCLSNSISSTIICCLT